MNQNNKDIDLSNKLKDSNDVEIQNNKQTQTTSFFPSETPKIIQWTIRYSGGLIKDEKQANYVLIGFVAIVIIIILIIFFNGNNEKQEIITPEAEAPIEKVIN